MQFQDEESVHDPQYSFTVRLNANDVRIVHTAAAVYELTQLRQGKTEGRVIRRNHRR